MNTIKSFIYWRRNVFTLTGDLGDSVVWLIISFSCEFNICKRLTAVPSSPLQLTLLVLTVGDVSVSWADLAASCSVHICCSPSFSLETLVAVVVVMLVITAVVDVAVVIIEVGSGGDFSGEDNTCCCCCCCWLDNLLDWSLVVRVERVVGAAPPLVCCCCCTLVSYRTVFLSDSLTLNILNILKY